MKDILSSIQDRRSFYSISKKSPISDQRIEELVGEAVKHTPSPYNIQSQRAVLLFGKEHDRLWDFVKARMKAKLSPERYEESEPKLDAFQAGYGTVLFFDDTKVTDDFGEEMKNVEKFRTWSQQANGMLQYGVWNLLESEGLGASLQHYNPLIDEDVRKAWDLPESWSLIAQMPFGLPTARPDAKKFEPLEKRFKVFH